MHLSGLDRFLWAIGLINSILLLYVLFFRKRAKTFPIFGALIAYSVCSSFFLSLIPAYLSPRAYYYTYWSLGAIDVLLQVALVYEIARHVFAPLKQWAPDVRTGFIALICGSVTIAAIFVALASPVETNFLARAIGRGNLFVDILLTEMFAGLVVLSAMAGLPWRTHVARIAQGMGAFALACVLSNICGVWLSWRHDASTIRALARGLDIVGQMSFAYCTITLWHDAPEPRAIPESMRTEILHLNRQLEYDLGRVRGWRKVE